MSRKIKGIIYIVAGVSPILIWMVMTTNIMVTLGMIALTAAVCGLGCAVAYGICLIQEK